MAEQNAVATQQGTQLSVVAQVKSMISQDAVKKKFTEVLGQKAPQFLASITNVIAGSAQLKKCPATTIMSAAFKAVQESILTAFTDAGVNFKFGYEERVAQAIKQARKDGEKA